VSKHFITHERRRAIMEQLAQQQVVTVAELSSRFGVSEVCIRRDLQSLEMHGLIRRIHGGAVGLSSVALGDIGGHTCAIPKDVVNAEVKARIGRAAAQRVRSGERVIFDSGTTVLYVAHYVASGLGSTDTLTAITNSLPVVVELGQCAGVNLIVLGGVYLRCYQVMVGPQAVEQIKGLYADKLFLGADGLTIRYGLTTANVLEAEVDRVIAEAAAEIIVVADSSKIGVVGLTPILPLAKISTLITDDGAPSDFLASLRDLGVEVVVV